MKERILFAPGANDAELLRSLARFGVNTIGLRIMGARELAEYALMKSGICTSGKYISLREQVFEMFRYVSSGECDYFRDSSFADAENLCRAVNNLRRCVPADRVEALLERGEFQEKNRALLNAYRHWTDYLAANGCCDSISIVTLAAEQAEKLDCEVTTLKEFPLCPLERKLLNILATESEEMKLHELFGREEAEICIADFTAAYGTSNEIEDIIATICEKGIPLDSCVIALADTSAYPQAVFDFCQTYDIPATFGCGIPIANTNPARLLKLLDHWNAGSGYHGTDALRALVMSPAFDRSAIEELAGDTGNPYKVINGAIETAGALHLGMDADANRKTAERFRGSADPDDRGEARHLNDLDLALKMTELFCTGYAEFIEKFTKIRRSALGPLDAAARTAVCSVLRPFDESGDESGRSGAIGRILAKSVGCANSAEGCLHVTSLAGALSTVRENLFIAGLSADCFPGKPREDYLLLDSDYGEYADGAPTSDRIIKDNQDLLRNLICSASALKTETSLSWTDFSLAGLKDRNVSSEVMSLYREQHGSDLKTENVRRAGFFTHTLTPSSAAARQYSEGKHALQSEMTALSPTVAYNAEKRWSYSAISSFFECRRKFYLKNALGIDEPDPIDPYEVADAREFGTLIHKAMERLGAEKTRPGREQFEGICSEVFDAFLNWHAGRPDAKVDVSRRAFIETAMNAYEQDPGNEVVLAEESQDVLHEESGLLLHGYPDRIEKDREGRYLVADYKSGRTVKHIENDPVSCLQVLMYAYMAEKLHGIRIDRCEYRYPRLKQTVHCRYDDEMRGRLAEILTGLRESMERGDYAPVNCSGEMMTADKCKKCYCKFGPLCTRVHKEADDNADR